MKIAIMVYNKYIKIRSFCFVWYYFVSQFICCFSFFYFFFEEKLLLLFFERGENEIHKRDVNQVDNDWMVNTLVRAVQHVPKVILGACRRGVAGGVIENALHWRGSGRIGSRS